MTRRKKIVDASFSHGRKHDCIYLYGYILILKSSLDGDIMWMSPFVTEARCFFLMVKPLFLFMSDCHSDHSLLFSFSPVDLPTFASLCNGEKVVVNANENLLKVSRDYRAQKPIPSFDGENTWQRVVSVFLRQNAASDLTVANENLAQTNHLKLMFLECLSYEIEIFEMAFLNRL